MKTYKAKNGATQFKPSIAEVEAVMHGDNTDGFCLACGSVQGGVEPDARRYVCEGCGAAKVYGAEELLVMGLVYDEAAA